MNNLCLQAKLSGIFMLVCVILYLIKIFLSSERIHKSGVDGTILIEAKYINLSLHYLEQVRNEK
jgi:kinesin family protein 6/9